VDVKEKINSKKNQLKEAEEKLFIDAPNKEKK